MTLNPDKSETILLSQWAPCYSNFVIISLVVWKIPLAVQIKIFGVTLDKNLSMDNHVNSVSKSVHYHIRALRHIRPSVSVDMA